MMKHFFNRNNGNILLLCSVTDYVTINNNKQPLNSFALSFHRVEDPRDDIAYSFNGEGYAVRNRVSSGPYNKYTFGVSINFRTYDENALLFLAINPENVSIIVSAENVKASDICDIKTMFVNDSTNTL